MSANRKLQGEIQIVLKKVEEGVEIFDEIWGKVYAAEQQTLKEKYESDLKKEIKKLQRLRDQIKTWLSSNEIKDKTQIMEARKTIESKMELFKVCEKDTKTKAYSKEGLAREAKLDPKEALKEEKRGWLNDCLDKLNDLIDSVEAEREKVLGTSKGKSKNKESLERFDNRVQKHKWHMAKLELIIKLLDNDDLDPSLVSGIQDSLDYYIESAVDDDGALGVEHEFDIYEELELDSHGVAAPTFDLARPAKEDEDSPGAAVAASAGNDTADVTESEAPAPAAKKATAPAGVAAKGKAEPAATAAPTKAAAAAAPLGAKASPKVVPAVPAAATTTKNGASKANGGPKAAATVAASASDEADESSADSMVPAAASAATPASGPSMSWAAHAASAVPAASAPAPAPTASSRPQAAAPVPAATVTPSPAVVPVPAPAATAAAQQQQSVKSPAVSSVPSPALVPAKATSLPPQAASVVEAPPLPAAVPAAAVLSPAATVSAPPPPPPLQQAKINPELMVRIFLLRIVVSKGQIHHLSFSFLFSRS